MKFTILIIAIIFMTALIGCQKQQEVLPVEQAASITMTVLEPDPAKAIEEIYKNITIMGIKDATPTVLTDKFGIDMQWVEASFVRYATGDFGLSDVFIIKPKPDCTVKVREALEKVKLDRIKEFENYDVLDALNIAQKATVFEQGGYVVMLMLEDNQLARDILDQYIPK